MMVVSVISRHSWPAGSPDSSSASATTAMRSGCSSWRRERFTATVSGSRGSARLPARSLAAGLTQHPRADGQDEAGLLRQGDELGRGRSARARGAPSARAPPRRPRGRSPARPSAGSAVRSSPRTSARRRSFSSSRRRSTRSRSAPSKTSHARAPALLRTVHRGVGVAQQVVGRVVGARQGDADRRRQRHLARAERYGLAHDRGDAVGERQRSGLGFEVLGQEGELVTAEPGHRVVRAQDAVQSCRDGTQHLVAGVVAERSR